MGSWTEHTNLKINDSTKCIFCDTRDFYTLEVDKNDCDAENIDKDISRLRNKGPKKFKAYLIDESDILNTIDKLFERAGGKSDWRFLFHSADKRKNWIKYIRFYRIDEKTFVVTQGNDFTGLNIYDLVENVPSLEELVVN